MEIREHNTNRGTLWRRDFRRLSFFSYFFFFLQAAQGVGWPERHRGASALSFPAPTIPRTHPLVRTYTAGTARRGAQQTACDMFSYSPFPTPSFPAIYRPFDERHIVPPSTHVANVLVLSNIPLFLCGCFGLG